MEPHRFFPHNIRFTELSFVDVEILVHQVVPDLRNEANRVYVALETKTVAKSQFALSVVPSLVFVFSITSVDCVLQVKFAARLSFRASIHLFQLPLLQIDACIVKHYFFC